jgi:hypothetical protein
MGIKELNSICKSFSLKKKKKTEEYSVFLSECDLLIGVQRF